MARGCCRICEHARRPEIDAALLLKPIRAVASEFALSKSTLGCHKLKHVREAGKRALEKITAAYSARLRGYMARVQDETLAILTSARQSGDRQLALEAARACRENVECMRKLLSKTPDGKAKGAEPPAEIEIHYGEAGHVAHTQ